MKGTRRRIVIAEDSEVNRVLLYNILKDSYIVDMAGDGEEALQKLHRHREDTVALLLDLQMPKMDGFSVIAEMKKEGLQNKIPVLVISGERSVEIEDKCFKQGVSDFIHKPFETSSVQNRVKKAVEHFARRNQLEQQVEEQTETLKRQYQIIQMQAEELKQLKPFNQLMMQYRCAIMEVETRLKVLNDEFTQNYNRNPFESIKSRLKSPESIYEKLRRKGYPITVRNIEKYLSDVAGLRVICSFPDDIYRLAELFVRQDDIILLQEKDYIKHPKDNGYRSLHLIVNIPIFLSKGKKNMKVEVQFRTIAMDFWASLEHKLKYKNDMENADEIVEQLKTCADSIEALDYQMQEIRDKIDRSRG